MIEPEDPPCVYCGCRDFVFVHGHEQCTRCGNNIAPCCEGMTANSQDSVHIHWTKEDGE